MHRPTLRRVMRPLACAAALLAFFPFYNVLYAWLAGAFTPREALLAQGLTWALAALGGLAARAMGDKALALRLGVLLAVASAVFALAVRYFPGIALQRSIMALLPAAAVLAGGAFHRKNYGDVLSDRLFGLTTGVYAAAVFLLWLLEKNGGGRQSTALLTAAYLVCLFLYAVVRNQANIDFLMERRRHKLEHLPKKIRYYNFALIAGCFAAVLLCFLLRAPIARALRLLLAALRAAAGAVIRFFLWLASLFFSEDGEMAAPAGEQPGLPAGGEGNGLVQSILNVLFVAGFCLLLFYYRRQIARFLRERWEALCSLLRRLWDKAPLGRRPQAGESEWYFDRVETLPPQRAEAAEAANLSRRAFRREFRRFLRMPPGSEKYRFGYCLLLGRLRVQREDLRVSDTVLEIAQKTAALLPGEDYPRSADAYNAVRYGGSAPAEADLLRLERVLRQLADA